MSTPFHLNGKTILVTGASSGIGRQAAVHIAQMGGKVIAAARRENELKQTIAALEGNDHSHFACDLTDEEQMKKLVSSLLTLDGVVHCAGMVKPFPVKFIGTKMIDEVHGINYIAPVMLTAQLLKDKKIARNASIIFISSVSAMHAYKGGALYASAKAALESFSRNVAIEHAAQGIRSNCISPALVRTAVYDDLEKDVSKEGIDTIAKRYPLGFGEPADVANTIVFLLSGASRWITGTNIIMDGGLTAGD